MNLRPDPTFHATAKLAMQAPVETLAYTLLLSPHPAGPMAWPQSTSIPKAASFIHIAAMVLGGALMAFVTHERLRMEFIARSWFNLDKH